MWDLRSALGQDLGLAVIDAQDFFCFLRRESQILPERSRLYLTGWIEEAERIALDEDAAENELLPEHVDRIYQWYAGHKDVGAERRTPRPTHDPSCGTL